MPGNVLGDPGDNFWGSSAGKFFFLGEESQPGRVDDQEKQSRNCSNPD
jgi:hypothetical protein